MATCGTRKSRRSRGTSPGKQLHSSEYHNVGDIDGNRVLVVGDGNSGCDLAVDVAQHRLEADIVIRDGVYFQPKTYFGKPRQQVEFLAGFSPGRAGPDQPAPGPGVHRRVEHDYPGMPEPKHRTLAEGSTVVNDLLLYWIHHGRVRVVPGIERFEGNTVHFTDGTSKEYDTILWATGFHVQPAVPGRALLVAGVPAPRSLRRRHPSRGPRRSSTYRA